MSDLVVRVVNIDSVKPHPNADRLDLAVVGGWQCAVGRGNWHAGDACVYFPPDTLLPNARCREFEVENYVSKSDRYPEMGRIKCTRLRGEPSFGLCVPVPGDLAPESFGDCAEYFGAQKYEPLTRTQQVGRKMYSRPADPETIICSRCVPAGEYPWGYNEIQKRETRGMSCLVCGYSRPVAAFAAPEVAGFQKYTDIQNLRHHPDLFEVGEYLVVTEKIHGANCRIGVVWTGEDEDGNPVYEQMAGSHNIRHSDPASNNEHPEAARKSDTYWFPWTIPGVKNLLDALYFRHASVVLYGEVYGPGVQTLDYGRNDLGFTVFDLKVDGAYKEWPELVALCECFGVEHVPERGKLVWCGPESLETVRSMAEGPAFAGNHMREGVVVKPLHERHDPEIGRVVLKYLSDAYLLSKHHEGEVTDD